MRTALSIEALFWTAMRFVLGIGALLLLSLAIDAKAQENKSALNGQFSGSIGFFTDYAFRGISQTNEAPALQGNVDFLHDSGAKLGVWGSNINFAGNNDATAEFDLYAGYLKSFEKLSTEVGVIYYAYPGAESNLDYDYVEAYGSAGYDFGPVQITGSINHSPDFFGGSGPATYPRISVKIPLPEGFALDGWAGYQWIDNAAAYGVPDYADYAAGLSYTINDFTLKAQYVDTNLTTTECADGCDAKGILSLVKTFTF